MVRLTGNLTSTAGAAVLGASVAIFPTSRNADQSTAACLATATTTTNSSGLWDELALAANKYDVRIICGSSVRWRRYSDEVQHATFQTGDGCSSGTEGNFYLGIDLDVGLRWSTADADRHAFVIGLGASNQMHIAPCGDIATDWARGSNSTNAELDIHNAAAPATDYLALGNHDGTTATIDVVGGTTLALNIAGNTELTVTASGLNVPANSDILFTGTTGTNDINLVDSVADALSIVRGSTDVIVFNTSTPRVTITPATTITGLITSSGGITLPANADIAMTGTTGTNDIVLTNALADALSITDGAADIMVFDTATAGNVITITASLALDGDIDFTGPQEITTTSGDLTLNPTASLNVTLTVDDADAFDLSNDTSSYYLVSTINTVTGTVAHTFDTEDAVVASATGAVYTLMAVPGATYTFTGSTQMTSLQETVSVVGPTLATDSVGLTIDKATTLALTAPIEGTAGGGTTLTAASAVRLLNTSGTPTTQYGIFIEDLTAGATSDYGIWIAGADTAGIVIASADPLQLGVAGASTGTMNWQGATSGTVNMTVAAAAGSWTFTLPVNNGAASQVLQTDGCGVTSWATAAGGPCQAVQSEIEGESNVDKYIPPDLLNFAPMVSKGWAKFDGTVCGTTLDISYNVTGTCDTGTGRYTVTWATDFSSTNHADTVSSGNFHTSIACCGSATVTQISVDGSGHSAADDTRVMIIAFGDYA